MSAKPRYVITGGAGFIGSHIAERLAGSAELVLFDNLRRNSLATSGIADHPDVELTEGDIRDRDAVFDAVRGADAVFHLAAIAGVSSYYREPETTLRVNIDGTAGIVDAVVAAGVERLVYLSTSEVHGPEAHDVDEESPCAIGPSSDPRWVYATSKLAGEHLVLRGGDAHGFAATVLRPFNVYGPRQTGEGAIRNFCLAATGGEPLVVYGDGSAVRAWCYVDDFVDATLLALGNEKATGQVFNIGNPAAAVDTNELAAMVAALEPEARVEPGSVSRAEVAYRTPVIAKARRLLGFEPTVSLASGLERTLAWTRESLVAEVAP
ncbi:MAG TPA: NAD-dependent epimerase/dehydratase family protein [Solirubrobacterales bacterium]|nr:NAD-dependent epimerase/dehydratase family protein [Solirubrobacterales bacterium]